MSDSLEPLILDLLEWVGPEGRPYADVLAAWRTSCPRLPVWEEANDRGYLDHLPTPGQGTLVRLSVAGAGFLHERRPMRSTASGGSSA